MASGKKNATAGGMQKEKEIMPGACASIMLTPYSYCPQRRKWRARG